MENYQNDKSFKYFITIVSFAIIGIIFIFSYSYFYVNNELNTLKKEKIGLHIITQIENVVFDIQKLRGLSNILYKNKESKNQIEHTKQSLNKKLKLFKSYILTQNIDLNSKKKLIEYITTLNLNLKKNTNFDQLSKYIQESLILIEHISYVSELTLDKELDSHILMQSIVFILPSLIEYNGQIRGISSSAKNSTLSTDKKNKIMIQISKINDYLEELKFIFSLSNEHNIKIINNKIYNQMLNAQKSLIDYSYKLLKNQKININSYDLFKLNSKHINTIIKLYKINVKQLNEILNTRSKNKNNILIWIIIFAVISILFILTINIIFYFKSKNYIKKIELISITDGLTKLYNRRYFDMQFSKQINIQSRTEQNLIFAMIDVDHFKQYNDTYGHQAGDKTLISISSALNKILKRSSDMVFRLGGEEFGLLFVSNSEENTIKFANKIRENIKNLKIPHKNNSASNYITISMGLVIIKPNCPLSTDKIYKAADEALYTAKESGRDKVNLFICNN
jgi:diguanylate cyclase (GGDEF)-like protein